LRSFKRFALQKPFIKNFEIVLYPNEQDLFNGYERREFNLLANIRPYEITDQNTVITKTSPLPRMFGLFINTEHPFLQDQKLQAILRKAINTQEIANNVFQGFAQPHNSETDTQAELSSSLDALGWKMNPDTSIREKSGKPLSWSMSTADTPELKYSAQIIQKQLKSLGIEIELKVFQLSDLETTIIKNKSFDMLLFGQFIKNDADRYAFWHSSQKNISDLNITRYTDQKLDSLLEKLLTLPYTSPERTVVLQSIDERISLAPVIWLYQPQFIYASNTPIYQLTIDGLVTRDNRFQQVYQWFVKTDTVWKWFTR
jgi:ABC-type transport system substrate-binding protein